MSRWKMNGQSTGIDKRENRMLADKPVRHKSHTDWPGIEPGITLCRELLPVPTDTVWPWPMLRHYHGTCLPQHSRALTPPTPPGHFATNQLNALIQAPVVCYRGLCCKQHDVSTVGVCPSSGPRSESGYARDKQSRTLSSPPRVQTVVGGKI